MDSFERQVIAAATRLSFGAQPSKNFMSVCGAIMLKKFDPNNQIVGCSNGSTNFQLYVPPHRFNRSLNRWVVATGE